MRVREEDDIKNKKKKESSRRKRGERERTTGDNRDRHGWVHKHIR